MIRKSEPLSIPEVLGYLDKKNEKESNLIGFIEKFNDVKFKDAKQIKEKINSLNLMKLREEHIIKLIDFMPNNSEELNKILMGVNLDEDETKKILDTIKEFR